MGATYTVLYSGIDTGISDTMASSSISPTADAPLVVVAANWGGAARTQDSMSAAFSITGSWTKEDTQTQTGDGNMEIAVWTAVAASSPGSGALTMTLSGNHSLRWMAIFEVADEDSPLVTQTDRNNATTDTSPSDTFASTPDGDALLISGILLTAASSTSAAITPDSGWTEELEIVDGETLFQVQTAEGSNGSGYGWSTLPSDVNISAFIAIEIAGVSSGNTPLAAGSGSFTLSGSAAALEASRYLTGGSGTLALTGADAALVANENLPAESGTFTLTGANNAFTYGLKLPADSGSFDLIGAAAAIEHAALVTADSAAFQLNAHDVALNASDSLDAESGSYTLTGTAIDLTGALYFLAEMGVIQMAANDVTFNAGIALDAESGTFTLTGTDVAFEYSHPGLTADTTAFLLAGTDASLEQGASLPAESGTYTLTGSDASFSYSGGAFSMTAENGGFTLSGTAIEFIVGSVMQGDSGTYEFTGTDITISYSEEAIISIKGSVRSGLASAGNAPGKLKVH